MRNITAVSVGRSDYHILKSLYEILSNEKKISLNLIVIGSHLSKNFGYSFKNIEKKLFNKIFKIKLNLEKNDEINQNRSVSEIVCKTGIYFNKHKTDLLIVLGDRFEMFAVVIAAMNFRIPIAHIHGGELTLGAIDDSIRHCITKLSHIHFVTHRNYKKRLIQLGENSKNIIISGSLSNDRLANLTFLKKKDLELKYNFKFRKINILVTFHPETLNETYSNKQIIQLLNALKYFNEDYTFLYTSPNNDIGSKFIIKKIKDTCIKKDNHYFVKTMENDDYYSMIKNFDILVGNSSSGIIEAPYFKKPNINIGLRQEGREKAQSNIDCIAQEKQIIHAIKKSLSNKFRNRIKNMKNPYFKKNSNNIVAKNLKDINLKNLVQKKFVDRF